MQKDNRKDQSHRGWRAVPGQEWRPGNAERQGTSSLMLARAQWDSGCAGGGEDRRLEKRERGLLKSSQCITQNVRVYSFILGFAGTENPEQKCHRLSCLITCCLLTPPLQGACLNLPLRPQGTWKLKTSRLLRRGSWSCLSFLVEELPSAAIRRLPRSPRMTLLSKRVMTPLV